MINSGLVVLHFIPTHMNVADALTKPLPESLYIQHRTTIMNGHNGINPLDTLGNSNNSAAEYAKLTYVTMKTEDTYMD